MYLFVDNAWHAPDLHDPNLTACGVSLAYGSPYVRVKPAVVHCGPDATPKPKSKKK